MFERQTTKIRQENENKKYKYVFIITIFVDIICEQEMSQGHMKSYPHKYVFLIIKNVELISGKRLLKLANVRTDSVSHVETLCFKSCLHMYVHLF